MQIDCLRHGNGKRDVLVGYRIWTLSWGKKNAVAVPVIAGILVSEKYTWDRIPELHFHGIVSISLIGPDPL